MHWSPDMLMRMRPSGKTVSVIESQGVCNYGRRGVLLSLFNFSHLYKRGFSRSEDFLQKEVDEQMWEIWWEEHKM